MAVNFDKIAPFYDALARLVFGDALQKSQLHTLNYIPQQSTILILGGGTGWYLQEVLQKKQVKKVVYVESSAAMIELSRKKMDGLSYTAQVEFRLGTEQSLQPDERFDVIVTHFVLDLFPEPQVQQMVAQLNSALRPGGIWLCSDFERQSQQAGLGWKHVLVWAMYVFFRKVSQVEAKILPDIPALFLAGNFSCVEETAFYHQLIQSRVYEKIERKDIKSER